MQASLNLGPSFAELCAKDFYIHSYLPKENLLSIFQKLKNAFPEQNFEKLIISCRYLEKIYQTKLGGSVAQLVTMGFETWPALRQPLLTPHFVAHPTRSEALASQDLIFGVPERIDSEGKIIKPIDLAALEFIHAKLKMMNVTKVCVNLLFANKNPSHQIKVIEYFTAQGFDVFCASRLPDSRDEVTAWRTNTLNACLSGTFHELLAEIHKATEGIFAPEQIFFLDSKGFEHNKPLNELCSLAFAWTHSLPTDYPTLNLGLESWSWVEPKSEVKWKSPWGSVEMLHRKVKNLSVQPTQKLEKTFFEDLFLSEQQEGFEPGPMSWGRSQKPLLVDALFSQFSDSKKNLEKYISTNGQLRYHEVVKVLLKNSNQQKNRDVESFEKNLIEKTMQLIDFEIPQKKYYLQGFFAPAFLPLLKKRNHHVLTHSANS